MDKVRLLHYHQEITQPVGHFAAAAPLLLCLNRQSNKVLFRCLWKQFCLLKHRMMYLFRLSTRKSHCRHRKRSARNSKNTRQHRTTRSTTERGAILDICKLDLRAAGNAASPSHYFAAAIYSAQSKTSQVANRAML